jgi:hypothetical protein
MVRQLRSAPAIQPNTSENAPKTMFSLEDYEFSPEMVKIFSKEWQG